MQGRVCCCAEATSAAFSWGDVCSAAWSLLTCRLPKQSSQLMWWAFVVARLRCRGDVCCLCWDVVRGDACFVHLVAAAGDVFAESSAGIEATLSTDCGGAVVLRAADWMASPYLHTLASSSRAVSWRLLSSSVYIFIAALANFLMLGLCYMLPCGHTTFLHDGSLCPSFLHPLWSTPPTLQCKEYIDGILFAWIIFSMQEIWRYKEPKWSFKQCKRFVVILMLPYMIKISSFHFWTTSQD